MNAYELKQEEKRAFRSLLEQNAELLEALKLCQTRIFNYMSGMDENRKPDATKALNEEAFQVAKEAIKKAKG